MSLKGRGRIVRASSCGFLLQTGINTFFAKQIFHHGNVSRPRNSVQVFCLHVLKGGRIPSQKLSTHTVYNVQHINDPAGMAVIHRNFVFPLQHTVKIILKRDPSFSSASITIWSGWADPQNLFTERQLLLTKANIEGEKIFFWTELIDVSPVQDQETLCFFYSIYIKWYSICFVRD